MKSKRYPVSLSETELQKFRELSKEFYGKENLSGYMSMILRKELNNKTIEPKKESNPIKVRTNNKSIFKTNNRPMQKKPLTPQQLQEMVNGIK